MKKILQRMIGVDIDSWNKTGQLVENGRVRSRAGFIRDAHIKYLKEYLVYDSLTPKEKHVILVKELEELLERLRMLAL